MVLQQSHALFQGQEKNFSFGNKMSLLPKPRAQHSTGLWDHSSPPAELSALHPVTPIYLDFSEKVQSDTSASEPQWEHCPELDGFRANVRGVCISNSAIANNEFVPF